MAAKSNNESVEKSACYFSEVVLERNRAARNHVQSLTVYQDHGPESSPDDRYVAVIGERGRNEIADLLNSLLLCRGHCPLGVAFELIRDIIGKGLSGLAISITQLTCGDQPPQGAHLHDTVDKRFLCNSNLANGLENMVNINVALGAYLLNAVSPGVQT